MRCGFRLGRIHDKMTGMRKDSRHWGLPTNKEENRTLAKDLPARDPVFAVAAFVAVIAAWNAGGTAAAAAAANRCLPAPVIPNGSR